MPRNPDWTEEELILVIEFLDRHGARVPDVSDPEIVALSDKLRSLPIHAPITRLPAFRSPNSIRLKCFNLLANEPGLYAAKNLVATNAEIWRRHWGRRALLLSRASMIASSADELLATSAPFEDDGEFLEGGIVLRAHRMRERNSGLRPALLKRCMRERGRLECKSCDIDETAFASAGVAARSVFEMHHLHPLRHRGKKAKTSLNDVVLLCANCHRLIHGLMVIRGCHVVLEDLRALKGGAEPIATTDKDE